MSAPNQTQPILQKLKNSTKSLNQITDDVSGRVQALEDFLNKECSLGVEAQVVFEELTDIDSDKRTTSLAYKRMDGKFRIAVISVYDNDKKPGDAKPWSEWDRDTKLRSARHLPELLHKISEAADAVLQTAKQAAEATLYLPSNQGGK